MDGLFYVIADISVLTTLPIDEMGKKPATRGVKRSASTALSEAAMEALQSPKVVFLDLVLTCRFVGLLCLRQMTCAQQSLFAV